MIRRHWTPGSADTWSREDYLAGVLSAVAYLLIILGSALSLLASFTGYIILLTGVISGALMYYVIDPKLRALSKDYASRQSQYQDRVDRITRWEEDV